jgi:L-asparagine transporter-like permease
VLNGGFAAGDTGVSLLVLLAVLASFCGILYQLTRILLGRRKQPSEKAMRRTDGIPAMALMLGTLLVFSLWLPAPLLELMRRAAGIIRGD